MSSRYVVERSTSSGGQFRVMVVASTLSAARTYAQAQADLVGTDMVLEYETAGASTREPFTTAGDAGVTLC